jgi:predicted nucleic acid-binding Zn ribbon protein
MTARRGPRPVGVALRGVRTSAEPPTLLAAVQGAWARCAGEAVSREAEPVAEREGVITIACRTATWAQELDLLQTELLERLNEALTSPESGRSMGPVRGVRFTADAARRF